MSRIKTRYLDDPALDDAALHAHVEPFADTGSTGGTAIDAAGNLYVSATRTNHASSKITPKGEVSTLIQDPRLAWVDAMWGDDKGNLWLPAAQLHRTKGFNGGGRRGEISDSDLRSVHRCITRPALKTILAAAPRSTH